MTKALTDVIAFLLLPPASPLLIAIAGLLLLRRRPRFGVAAVAFGLAALWLSSLGIVGKSLLRLLEPSLRYAARLARETRLPSLLSGGNPYGEFPEAEAMARTMKADFGVEARWIEKSSATTAENAARTFAMLAQARITRIALVTTAWHMPRARRAFAAAGFDVVPAPTSYVSRSSVRPIDLLPSVYGLAQTRIAMWELLGSAWYSFRSIGVAGLSGYPDRMHVHIAFASLAAHP